MHVRRSISVVIEMGAEAVMRKTKAIKMLTKKVLKGMDHDLTPLHLPENESHWMMMTL